MWGRGLWIACELLGSLKEVETRFGFVLLVVESMAANATRHFDSEVNGSATQLTGKTDAGAAGSLVASDSLQAVPVDDSAFNPWESDDDSPLVEPSRQRERPTSCCCNIS